MKKFLSRLSAVAALLLASHGSAFACAACWNPAGNDKMTHAATVGIFAMVVIMFIMLGAVAGFGFYLNYRAKHPLPDYQELLGDDAVQPNPGTTP